MFFYELDGIVIWFCKVSHSTLPLCRHTLIVFVNAVIVLTNADAVLTLERHSPCFSMALKSFPHGTIITKDFFKKRLYMKKWHYYSVFFLEFLHCFRAFFVFLHR